MICCFSLRTRSFNRDRDGYRGGRGGGGRDGGREGGRDSRNGGGRFQVYDRPPYSDYSRPDPYADYYARSRMMAAYDRYAMDPYERRMAPGAIRGSSGSSDPYSRDPYARPSPEYYARRSPPRDPYYDYYERRRYDF